MSKGPNTPGSCALEAVKHKPQASNSGLMLNIYDSDPWMFDVNQMISPESVAFFRTESNFIFAWMSYGPCAIKKD